MKKFPASLDTMSSVITFGIVCVMMSVIAIIWITTGNNDSIGAKIYPTLLMSMIIVVAYSCSPRAFSIGSNGIVVHRHWDNVTIPFSDIKSAVIIEKVSNKGLIRTFGNGGLFGYYGDFRNREMGDMKWYLRRRCNVVLLETAKSKILLSPNDSNGFLLALQPHIAQQV